MNSKVLAPLALVGIGAAFVAVSIIYAIRKKPGLLAKKLKLGGILIALTTLLSGTAAAQSGDDLATCYKVYVLKKTEFLGFTAYPGKTAITVTKGTTVLECSIKTEEDYGFKYFLHDFSGGLVVRGRAIPGTKPGLFTVSLPWYLAEGLYTLHFEVGEINGHKLDRSGTVALITLTVTSKE